MPFFHIRKDFFIKMNTKLYYLYLFILPFIFVLSLLISKKYTNFLKNLKKILVFS